ncbi:ABC transporter substrate-binding protein [Tumidithrix elongata RA019]|uniref:ABC transporter substrate-binding protein n=1 Tax=Tumidithrix elongata BACA0141 TaxID=2716417 RepID=A0AAW9Q0T8_9CYAN|nr:ABC transporter substrate-binding protein [Tumidithrix elongata RA019]
MRHRILTVLLLFLITFGLITCTNQTSTNPPNPNRDTSFRIWWNEGYFPEETATIRKIVAAWEKQSGKRANLTIYSEKDLAREVKNAIERDNPPDILYSYSGDFSLMPRLAWQNKLADVSDVIQPAKDLYEPSALQAVSYENNTTKKRSFYAIPISQNTTYIHYWKDLLEESGSSSEKIPKDWNAFWKFWGDSQTALRQKGKSELYAMGMPMSVTATDTFYQFEEFLEAYNVQLIDKDGRLQLDAPETRKAIVAALTQYSNFYKDGLVPPKAIDWADPDNNIEFLSRKTVMTPNPSLSIPGSQRQDKETYFNKMATVEWPNRVDGKPLTYLVAVKQACLFEASTNKEIAKNFLSFLINPDNLSEFVKGSQGRFFPVMTKQLSDPFWNDVKDPHISVAVKQLKNTRPFYQVVNPAYTEVQSQNIWGKAIRSIDVDGKTPEQAADKAIADIKQIFSDWK